MKKVLKWLGISLGGIIGLLVVALAAAYYVSERDLNTQYDIEPVFVEISEPDSAMLARGQHLSRIRGCTTCHGVRLAGELLVDNFLVGTLSSSNLTSGTGGIGSTYSDKDWVRAIRHAVGPEGRPLKFMPSHEFIQMGREDLTALIAYLKQMPQVDWTPPDQRVGPLARVFYALKSGFPLLEIRKIDHSVPLKKNPPEGVTPEYGRYVAVSCPSCHGQDLAGAETGPPGTPRSGNLTVLQRWTRDEFIRAVREGVRPSGDTLDAFMPRWTSMTDTEVNAIWAFLQTLDPIEAP